MYAWHTRKFARGMDDSWLTGNILTVAARPFLEPGPNGVPEGYISGLMAARPPRLVRDRILPTRETLNLPTWEAKLEPMYEECKGKDIRMMIGLPAIALYLLTHVHQQLNGQPLDSLWPGFSWVASTGTALTPLLRRQFQSMFSPQHTLGFFEAYLATEGQFAYSASPDNSDLMLDPVDTFYQFEETPGAVLKQLHELELGKTYAIIVTTPGGLVNYRMGDMIKVRSLSPVSIGILGREYEEISAAGEKMCTSKSSAP